MVSEFRSIGEVLTELMNVWTSDDPCEVATWELSQAEAAVLSAERKLSAEPREPIRVAEVREARELLVQARRQTMRFCRVAA